MRAKRRPNCLVLDGQLKGIVHIAEATGSNPVSPTATKKLPDAGLREGRRVAFRVRGGGRPCLSFLFFSRHAKRKRIKAEGAIREDHADARV